MKNFFIGLLLAIFSIQGAIAAIGNDADLHGQGQASAACSSLPWVGATVDTDAPEVFPVIEELSDYVIIGLPAPKVSYSIAVSPSLPVHLHSTDLPKLKPPPKT